MHPTLKMSQILSYLKLRSFRLAISGATYPGVPHLGKAYYATRVLVARPKSTMRSCWSELASLNMMFSGLRSLCMMFWACMQATPVRIY